MKRPPTSPGEILNEEFLKPLLISPEELSQYLDCKSEEIYRILNQQTRVTPEIAAKFATVFKTTPDFWLNAQRAVDFGSV